ncbi:hypothetical protein [Sphingobacterium hungaricum]|uniref:Uncharacterized protein n=1 Tax=Sphingobacterium hungaricum TaxID=2082723 RepID=A0A928YPL9_9SPHI|nr:hypothetical protein [Sphingobacterium hungaricum]MBE8712662.1 hypothetical protein [Sphingobacterium hungaricum]
MAKNDLEYKDTKSIPRGWPNAIVSPNTLPILNYSLSARGTTTIDVGEFGLPCLQGFKVYGELGPKLEIGTLYTDAALGAEIELGWFDIPSFNRNIGVLKNLK